MRTPQSAERALWLSVINIGLRDAKKGRDENWVWSKDFDRICMMVSLSPSAVRSAITNEGNQLALRR